MDGDVYKIVDSPSGHTVAQLNLVEGCRCLSPETSDSQVRANKVLTVYIENNEPEGWGPVDSRTVYRVGAVTESHDFNDDETTVSGAGIHAFREREDALDWMEQADLEE